jgi:hypothetical protein
MTFACMSRRNPSDSISRLGISGAVTVDLWFREKTFTESRTAAGMASVSVPAQEKHFPRVDAYASSIDDMPLQFGGLLA